MRASLDFEELGDVLRRRVRAWLNFRKYLRIKALQKKRLTHQDFERFGIRP